MCETSQETMSGLRGGCAPDYSIPLLIFGYFFSSFLASSALVPFRSSSQSIYRVVRPPPFALGINGEIPKFPQYAVYSKRLESFDAWPKHIPVKKEDLVEAGLVYTGVCDNVRCYFCGGGLRNWERGDVPMDEHAKWYPKCPHIMLVKGQDYVEILIRREKLDEDGPQSQSDASHMPEPDALESIPAHSCLQMGYSKEIVTKAIQVYRNRHGNSDYKAKDLGKIILDLEDQGDDSPDEDDLQYEVERKIPHQESEMPRYLANSPAQSCLQMGFSQEMVKEAIETYVYRNGHSDFKAKDLAEIIFELEDRADESELVDANHGTVRDQTMGTAFGDLNTIEPIEILLEENRRLKERTRCKRCLNSRSSTVFIPCGHLVTCTSCAADIQECPVCREVVENKIQINTIL